MTATRVALLRSVPEGDHLGVEAIASRACDGYVATVIAFALGPPRPRPAPGGPDFAAPIAPPPVIPQHRDPQFQRTVIRLVRKDSHV